MALLLMMRSYQQNSAIALVTSEKYCQEFKATGVICLHICHTALFSNFVICCWELLFPKRFPLNKVLNPKSTKSAISVQHFVTGNPEAFKWKLWLKSNLSAAQLTNFLMTSAPQALILINTVTVSSVGTSNKLYFSSIWAIQS